MVHSVGEAPCVSWLARHPPTFVPLHKARAGPNRQRIENFFLNDWMTKTCETRCAGHFNAAAGSAEGSRAEGSAGAEGSALPGARDAELFHLGLERRPFHRQAGRGAVGTAEHPVGFTEHAEDV